jgi:hypothetical protein
VHGTQKLYVKIIPKISKSLIKYSAEKWKEVNNDTGGCYVTGGEGGEGGGGSCRGAGHVEKPTLPDKGEYHEITLIYSIKYICVLYTGPNPQWTV